MLCFLVGSFSCSVTHQAAPMCSSTFELGNALMASLLELSQVPPPAVEAELMVVAHHFYDHGLSMDGKDVLCEMAKARMEAWAQEVPAVCSCFGSGHQFAIAGGSSD